MTASEAFDVAVVGGGSAGVAAALGAAAHGARTLLVEQSDTLGGNVSQANVHTICGLFHAADPASEDVPTIANDGLCRSLPEALIEAGVARQAERAGRVWVLPISPPDYAHYLSERVAAAGPQLQCRVNTELTAAGLSTEASGPNSLDLDSGGQSQRVHATLVVDASGDGVLASRAGAGGERETPERLQRPSYIFRLQAVGDDALAGFARMRISTSIAGAAHSGKLPEGCESVLVRPGQRGEAYVTVNIPPAEGADYQPQDDGCRVEMESRGQRYANAITELLRERYEAFRECEIAALPKRLGVREGTRLLGRSVVRTDDILTGRRCNDEVALSTWPVELWHDHRRAEMRYPKGPAGIPLGALISGSHPKLAMAGRCMSASHDALGALRVIGTALATGEAAGRAAAIAAARGCDLSRVDAKAVREAIARGDA